MNEPSVSIITPCYNGERYVKETIESVLAQTYTDWEMLVIDDGSQDQSAAIIQSYADKDPRIQLISQENAGSSAARNNGIRRARGRYIALLDADDLWDPEFLSKQIAYLTEKQCVCVYCSYRRINENSQEIGHPTKARPFITTKDMKVMNQIGCLSGLYDREKYGKIYLKEELKSLRDDYAYWYDIVSLEDKVYGNPEVLCSYRVLPNSTTGKKFKLIKVQYSFYRTYLHENRIAAAINTLRWGLAGIIKFS